ncbi:MAG: hypothetical protein GC158_13150 [Cyanobacteria bacterium RI_101]|nr:hypothetical protein [Cyanobacteria bacterium RI_101]
MTGNVLEPRPKGLLVLILPLAVVMVLVYKAWRLILLVTVLVGAYLMWDAYQWRQKCVQIDPAFNQLLQTNQGVVTQADLITANIAKGSAARRYLRDKAEEYGAYQRQIQGATAYYFLTASTLGAIFDESEPEAPALSASPAPVVELPAPPPPSVEAPAPTSSFAQLLELKKEEPPEPPAPVSAPVAEPAATAPSQTLIQSELAKRLDTTSSTIARRKEGEDFPEWSQSKDPEGLAWRYDPESKLFMTV